jgi:hypothetical protein
MQTSFAFQIVQTSALLILRERRYIPVHKIPFQSPSRDGEGRQVGVVLVPVGEETPKSPLEGGMLAVNCLLAGYRTLPEASAQKFQAEE